MTEQDSDHTIGGVIEASDAVLQALPEETDCRLLLDDSGGMVVERGSSTFYLPEDVLNEIEALRQAQHSRGRSLESRQ
jgi:hypothetical protein